MVLWFNFRSTIHIQLIFPECGSCAQVGFSACGCACSQALQQTMLCRDPAPGWRVLAIPTWTCVWVCFAVDPSALPSAGITSGYADLELVCGGPCQPSVPTWSSPSGTSPLPGKLCGPAAHAYKTTCWFWLKLCYFHRQNWKHWHHHSVQSSSLWTWSSPHIDCVWFLSEFYSFYFYLIYILYISF